MKKVLKTLGFILGLALSATALMGQDSKVILVNNVPTEVKLSNDKLISIVAVIQDYMKGYETSLSEVDVFKYGELILDLPKLVLPYRKELAAVSINNTKPRRIENLDSITIKI